MTTENMDYWEKNGLIKPQQYIVCAACRYKNIILAGARHFDSVMKSQMEYLEFPEGEIKGSDWEQGFIDQFGEFINREDAFVIAELSGQPLDIKRNGSETELFSEGLY